MEIMSTGQVECKWVVKSMQLLKCANETLVPQFENGMDAECRLYERHAGTAGHRQIPDAAPQLGAAIYSQRLPKKNLIQRPGLVDHHNLALKISRGVNEDVA